LQEILGAAQLAGDAFGGRGGNVRPRLIESMQRADDATLRFWIARWAGQYVHESPEARSGLELALGDADGSVRVAAATWLARTEDAQQAIDQLAAALGNENWWTRLRAANVLELLGMDAPPLIEQIRKTHEEATADNAIGAGYVARATETILEKVGSD
jgi:HEAT repeat protein